MEQQVEQRSVDLTPDSLYCIFRYLGAGELLVCALVCRSWNKAANRDLLWEHFAALSWRSDGFKKRYIEWLRKEIRDYYMPLNRLSCMERDYSTGQVRLKDSVFPAVCRVQVLTCGVAGVSNLDENRRNFFKLFRGFPLDDSERYGKDVTIRGVFHDWRGEAKCRISSISMSLEEINGYYGEFDVDYRTDLVICMLPSPPPHPPMNLPTKCRMEMFVSYPLDGETWGDDTPYIKYCAEKKIPYVRANWDLTHNVENPKSFYHLEVPEKKDNWKTFQDKGIPSLHRWQSALLELAASTTGHPRSLLTLEQLESLLPKEIVQKSRENFEAISKAQYGVSGPGSPAGPSPGTIQPPPIELNYRGRCVIL